MNVAMILEASAREFPTRTALVCGSTRLTYQALDAEVNRAANGLRARGIVPGDRVALSCPSTAEFVIAYFALMKIAAVAVPLNLLLKPDEITYQLEASEAALYICHEGGPELPLGKFGRAAFDAVDTCREFVLIPARDGVANGHENPHSWASLSQGQSGIFESIQVDGDTTCSITFTSGTTGLPKGVELSHNLEYINAATFRNECPFDGPQVVLSALPLFTAWRCGILHTSFMIGATVVIVPRFNPAEVWHAMAREKVTMFHGVGAMFHALYHARDTADVDFDSIARHWRICAFGGAPVEMRLREFFQTRFNLCMIHGYGLTEVFFAVLDTAPPRTAGLLGRPVPGVQIRIVDEKMSDVPNGELGEIIMRTPMLMKGYYRQPEWTADAMRGGWFHSGDVGCRDDAGNLYLIDRIKDMVNRGGYKVYPAQVEQTLRQHPAVEHAAVIGIPHERLGEEVKACIVLKKNAVCTEEELVSWASENIAAYAYPRHIEFMAALPMSPTGKVLKRLLPKSAGEKVI